MRQTVSEANRYLRPTLKTVENGGRTTIGNDQPGAMHTIEVTSMDPEESVVPSRSGLSAGATLPTRHEINKRTIFGKFPVATQAEFDALSDAMKDKAIILTVNECPIGSEVKAIECNASGVPVDAHNWVMGLNGWKGGDSFRLVNGAVVSQEPILAPRFATTTEVRPMRAFQLGDSITANGGGILIEAAWQSGGRLRWVTDGGKGGDKCADCMARLPGLLAAWAPDLVAVQMGTNNDSGGIGISNAADWAEIYSQYIAAAAMIRAAGATPVFLTLTPKNSDGAGVQQKNAAIERAARDAKVTISRRWRRYNLGDGTYKSGWSTDGTHPTRENGIYLEGAELLTDLQNAGIILPLGSYRIASNASDPYNAFTNALCLVDTNSDGWADGFVRYGPAGVGSIVPNTDPGGIGNWQKIALDGTAANVGIRCDIANSFAAGEKLILKSKLKIEVTTGTIVPTLWCNHNDALVNGDVKTGTFAGQSPWLGSKVKAGDTQTWDHQIEFVNNGIGLFNLNS